MIRGNLYAYGDFFIDLDSEDMDNSDHYALSRLQQHNPIIGEFIEAISALDGVEDIQIGSTVQSNYVLPDGAMGVGQVAGYSPEESEHLNTLMNTGNCDYERMKDENGIVVMVASTLKEVYGWTPTVGDVVTLQFWTPQGIVSREFTVQATCNDRFKEGTFLLPEDILREIQRIGFLLKVTRQSNRNWIRLCAQ